MLNLTEDATLAHNEQGQKAPFHFVSGPGTTYMKATFYIIGLTDGHNKGEEVIVTWKAKPVSVFTLQLLDLAPGDVVSPTNRFKVMITKTTGGQGGQGIEGADIPNLVIHVTKKPDDPTAAVISGNVDQITFANRDLDPIKSLVKELQVTPGAAETKFVLHLKHGGKDMDTKEVTWKAPAAATYQLGLNPKDIQDGATKVTVTITKGTEVLQADELGKLQLHIKRTAGSSATIEGIDTGKLKFDVAGFTITTDKKSAFKDLTITPGTDKKAAFELQLIDGTGVAIAKETLTWTNGINLKMEIH